MSENNDYSIIGHPTKSPGCSGMGDAPYLQCKELNCKTRAQRSATFLCSCSLFLDGDDGFISLFFFAFFVDS